MKFPKLFKKAAALVMAAVTTFSVLPATTAFAAGDIGTISFDFTYDRNGNAMRYNSSAVFDGYTAGGTGSYKYRMYVDGDNAFCIQPGVPLKTGNTLKKILLRHGMPFLPARKKQWDLPCSMAIRETAVIFREVMMKNGLPHRPFSGNL